MTMVNGRADVVGAALELGEFLPEKRPVRINGNTYYAWLISDGHYERNVLARTARAYARYLQRMEPLTRAPLPKPAEVEGPIYEAWKRESDADLVKRNEAMANQEVWYDEYLTEVALLLVPGLQETEANLIPRDKIKELFEELGFWTANEKVDAEVEKAATEAPLDGPTSLPVSSSSTEPTSETS